MSGTPDSERSEDSEQTPGQRLRAAREERGLDLRQAAGSLLVDPEIIQALESDDYESLGAPVFVKGHLRNYAELLDLPSGPLVHAYESLGGAEPPPLVGRSRRPREPVETSTATATALTLGVMLVVAALFVAWWFARGEGFPSMTGRTSTTVELEPSATERAAAGSTDDAAQDDPDAAGGSVDGESSDAVTAPEANESGITEGILLPEPAVDDGSAGASDDPAVASDEVATDTTSVDPGDTLVFDTTLDDSEAVELSLIMSGESWVELRDADGETQVYNLYRGGDEIDLRLRAPVYVFLGNAPAVRVVADGSSIEIDAVVRRDNTARFRIDADGEVVR